MHHALLTFTIGMRTVSTVISRANSVSGLKRLKMNVRNLKLRLSESMMTRIESGSQMEWKLKNCIGLIWVDYVSILQTIQDENGT